MVDVRKKNNYQKFIMPKVNALILNILFIFTALFKNKKIVSFQSETEIFTILVNVFGA